MGPSFRSFSLRVFASFALVLAFSTSVVFAAEDDISDPKAASDVSMQEGVVAFESKMYDFSKRSFERALELNRSNYDAMLYLAKAHYYVEEYQDASRTAINLVSSFYPAKELKIEAYQLLADVENKVGSPWLALSYIYASSDLSTSVDISHLIDDQLDKLKFDSLSYPEFESRPDGVLVSSTLEFDGSKFTELDKKGSFEQVSYASRQLKTRYVLLPGFDDRRRFTKMLMIRLIPGLKPKLEELDIQDRRRGGFQGASDLFVKIMDWNFDGYPDLVVKVSSRRSDNKYAFMLYNPRNDKFILNDSLSGLENPILDRKSKAVLEEECVKDKDSFCMRKRYKLFAGEYALAQFEKNICKKSCVYTKSEIEVSSLKSNEHMYLVNTIETEFDTLKSRFSSGKPHTIITRRVLKAYYTPNYDLERGERPIMMLDLDGSWEFPASYVKTWVNNYFSRQPLDGQLTEGVTEVSVDVIN